MIKNFLKFYIDKTTVNLNSDLNLNINIWNSITKLKRDGRISKNDLNQDQIEEYNKLKNLSENLINVHFDRNPSFNYITKISTGYRITRVCNIQNKRVCYWTINININTNETKLSCDKDCQHTNPSKKKSNFLFLFFNSLIINHFKIFVVKHINLKHFLLKIQIHLIIKFGLALKLAKYCEVH